MDRLDAYLLDLQLRELSPATINRFRNEVSRYLKWQAVDARGEKESLLAYLAFLRGNHLRQTSINAIFVALNSYYNYLQEAKLIEVNPVPAIQKQYLRAYKIDKRERQLISVDQARKMVRLTLSSRDKAILMILFKTGIRRHELADLDVEDIDFAAMKIELKPTAKRTNKTVFFDDECGRAIKRWLKARDMYHISKEEKALLISNKNKRMKPESVNDAVTEAALRVGLHNSAHNDKLDDKFTAHCCRHWQATHLLRAGMPREYVKWLRGDAMREAIDVYNHINPEDVRKSYLAHVPQLGI